MVSGDLNFTSFGKWIHVTMTLDGANIENNEDGTPKYKNKYMSASISWYELDNPETVYTVRHNGRAANTGTYDLLIETSSGAYAELGSIRQKDIASVVIPVAAANGTYIPTMEIDNLFIYCYLKYCSINCILFTK